jgi:D-alanyl-lipoteichoic acid acyltransferase DltB (MBOAT superfamily)
MLFNSLPFLIFFPFVFFVYWAIKRRSYQNVFLITASYFFYANWDWRFLFLLIFSTLLDYFSGIKIGESEHSTTRKWWLWLSIGINLGFLGIFKYYNFFVTSFVDLFQQFNINLQVETLNIILPVGISFYTFHGLSYVIDIYYRRISVERNFIDYSLFVSFFPLLVAGPIERAHHLLPQMKNERRFRYEQMVDGLRLILWGLFKKVAVADQCAYWVNDIFSNPQDQHSLTLIWGAVLFSFQIYGDFSGYSDIALGTARMLGFDLLRNFNFPYFSRSIAEFWRRWHISLSSWFKDYLYIPLGGSKGGKKMQVRNTLIIFLVSGFWHGANWTFIIWGLLNGLLILPSIFFNTNRNNLEIVAKNSFFPSIKEGLQILLTFSFTTIAWIFFRSESLEKSMLYIETMLTRFKLTIPENYSSRIVFLISILLLFEWFGRKNETVLSIFSKKPIAIRWGIYLFLSFSIVVLATKKNSFIYFQF